VPISRNGFNKLEHAPSLVEEIASLLEKNPNKGFSLGEIHSSIFGDKKSVADIIFERIALMILNERGSIDTRRQFKEDNGYELYFAWKIQNRP
jgi:hypothetical protein